MSDVPHEDREDRLKRQEYTDLIIECVADNVVRPCRPERRRELIAEWEKLVRYGAVKAPDRPNGEGGPGEARPPVS